jgi:hypothetical protein
MIGVLHWFLLTVTDLSSSPIVSSPLPELVFTDHRLSLRRHPSFVSSGLSPTKLHRADPDMRVSVPEGTCLRPPVSEGVSRGAMSAMSRRGDSAVSMW